MNPTSSPERPEPQETPSPSDPAARLSDEREAEIAEAIETIRHEGRASVSLLQRRLRWGYIRAASVVDVLQRRGILGEGVGAKSLTILNLPATRTPAPEAVAGERKPHCPFCGNLPRIQTWCEDDGSKHLICCQHIQSKVFDNEAEAWIWWAQRATPPVEADKDDEPEGEDCDHADTCGFCRARKSMLADKDAEIARLREEFRDLQLSHDSVCNQLIEAGNENRRLIEKCEYLRQEDIKADHNIDSLESDLTTARATIAERDKRIETLVGALVGKVNRALNAIGEIDTKVLRDAGLVTTSDAVCAAYSYVGEIAALAHAAEGKEQA